MFVELGKESTVPTGIPVSVLRSSVVSTVEVAVVVTVAPLIQAVHCPLLEGIKLVTPLLVVTQMLCSMMLLVTQWRMPEKAAML